MESKYYIPEIEEFHIGFDYEIYEDWDTYPVKTWYKQIFGEDGNNPENLGYIGNWNLDITRVKYLDIKDLESLGWKMQSGIDDFVLNEYGLDVFEDEIQILHYDECIFSGVIKNKSELKKLMKQLKINKII